MGTKILSQTIILSAAFSCIGFFSSAHAIELPDGWSAVRIGLKDDNLQWLQSKAIEINESGTVVGLSYGNNNTYAWIYDGQSTQKIEIAAGVPGERVTYGVQSINDAGRVLGTLNIQGSLDRVWTYESGQTILLGLTDAAHTRSDGYQASSFYKSNYSVPQSGEISGRSNLYSGNYFTGTSVWQYANGETTRIGFFDGAHTASDGLQRSDIVKDNKAGQVIGTSFRYSGTGKADYYSGDRGVSAWIYDSGTQTRLGFTGDTYTRADGFQESRVVDLDDYGRAVGTSVRFSGTSNLGRTAWLYDQGEYTTLGLTDTGHLRGDGWQDSRITKIDSLGRVWGYTVPLAGGESPWVYDGDATVQLGVTTDRSTKSDGARRSRALVSNQAGYIAGATSEWKIEDNWPYYYWEVENSTAVAWLYDGNEVKSIGRGEPVAMNESGQVIMSYVVEGCCRLHDTFWESNSHAYFYDGTRTIRLGPTGDWYGSSTPELLNNAGQVVGRTKRNVPYHDILSGEQWPWYSAWFYDSESDQIYDLGGVDSAYASSRVTFLSDDGLALGTYTSEGEEKEFAFTVDLGFMDLEDLVALAVAGEYSWTSLAAGLKSTANTAGQFISNEGYAAYFITPQPVPVPSAFWLLLSGLTGIQLFRCKSAAANRPH